jgi:hypothetical protein
MTREGLHSKSDIAAELGWRDYQIAELTRQLSELQLSQDNIINSLGIKGDGPVSKLVIEYVMGLVAENVALRECCKAYDADGLAEYGEQWEVTPLEIPNTDAAIAEIKAQGVDEFARKFNSETIEGSSMVMFAKAFAANLRAGRKG